MKLTFPDGKVFYYSDKNENNLTTLETATKFTDEEFKEICKEVKSWENLPKIERRGIAVIY